MKDCIAGVLKALFVPGVEVVLEDVVVVVVVEELEEVVVFLEGGAQGLGMGALDSTPEEAELELFPANEENGFEENCDWAALSMGSWISRYIRCSAL